MTGFHLIWLVLLLPIGGFLVQSLLGKKIEAGAGRKAVGFLAVLPIALAFLIGAYETWQLAQLPAVDRATISTLFNWIDVDGFKVPFELRIDPLSMTMVLIITGIGSLIHIYATAYMAEDRDFTRFFTYMNLFVAAMLLLVLGNNLLLLFIGWEGVGLCSYLLIGFWFKDLPNARAANKAFIVNRIGDWGLLIGLFMIVAVLISNGAPIQDGRYLSYDAIAGPLLDILRAKPAIATVIALLLFIGAAGKSAQFPLYLWLPDAMAGPTPVSALIHAATMVTSGVFLLNRMHYVFEMSPYASAVICAVGAFTAAYAALIAFGQTDIKRVLAYSTVSQLGFMFVACGAGAYWAGMYHVTTHAFFKALLFLGAGSVIYAMSHNQDMRNYGNLRKYLPITFGTMVIGWLAISGLPPLSGFFSKEAIIGSALASKQGVWNHFDVGSAAGWIALGVAFLTAVYMTRLTSLTFFGKEERWRGLKPHAHPHGQEHMATVEESPALADDPHGFYLTAAESEAIGQDEAHHHELDLHHTPKEPPLSMTAVLVVLAILSAAGGVLSVNNVFEHWLYPAGLPVLGNVPHAPEGIPLLALSVAAAVGGLLVGWFVYVGGLPKDQRAETGWKPWRRWVGNQFNFDYFVTTGAIEGGGELARAIDHGVERGGIDGAVRGVGKAAVGLGGFFKLIQTGLVRMYALVMLVGVVAFVGYFLYILSQMGGVK